ncbi:MAG TPA: prepilin-type N-terminal cleavage/methylation domain-containing protein [Bacteriovoracaceae bacterium]|nr:prepilin-type N-terminal cleavage/methylation domain-containing protein [Bacteriovoracaceae bacterium]
MKSWKKMISGIAGFTLVELMAVVAIIGVLSMVAVPNFQKYQVKARKTEAKTQLSSLYMAESGFYSDYDNYATCLFHMGFNPGPASGRYYAIGFGANAAVANQAADTNAGTGETLCATDGAAGDGHLAFSAGKTAGGTAPKVADDLGDEATVNTTDGSIGQTFAAEAIGNIGAGEGESSNTFSIDHQKIIKESAAVDAGAAVANDANDE